MDWKELDKVLNETRDEARRQLIAAGMPATGIVSAMCVRHAGDDDSSGSIAASFSCPGEGVYGVGTFSRTPQMAIAEVLAWWRNKGEEAVERAEFKAWKAQRAAQTPQ